MSNAFVCIMGIGTVFAGLICLVFISYVMSTICNFFTKSTPEPKLNPAQAPRKKSSGVPAANKGEIIAAACATIAEELGEDVKNIKVVSFKKA